MQYNEMIKFSSLVFRVAPLPLIYMEAGKSNNAKKDGREGRRSAIAISTNERYVTYTKYKDHTTVLLMNP